MIEGWISFTHQLAFAFARHDLQPRRTIFVSGRPKQDGLARSLLGLDAAPAAGEPWQIDKVYYDRMFSAGRVGAMITHLKAEDPESPLIERLTEMLERFSDRHSDVA